MKLTKVKCKCCGNEVFKKKSTARFCSEKCRKHYWRHHIEPRAVCEDCGTLLGVGSMANIRNKGQKPFCQSCSMFRRVGTGRDF